MEERKINYENWCKISENREINKIVRDGVFV